MRYNIRFEFIIADSNIATTIQEHILTKNEYVRASIKKLILIDERDINHNLTGNKLLYGYVKWNGSVDRDAIKTYLKNNVKQYLETNSRIWVETDYHEVALKSRPKCKVKEFTL